MGKSSTYGNLSILEHEVDQTSQIQVENRRVGRSEKVHRKNRFDRGEKIGKVYKSKQVSRIAKGGKISRANRLERVKGEKNRYVTINRKKVEKAEITETNEQ